MFRTSSLAVLGIIALSLAAPDGLNAQLRSLTDRAKRAAEDELSREVEEMVRGAVRCVFNDLDCIARAQDSGETVVLTDEDGEILLDEEGRPVTDPSQLPQTPSTSATPAANANYDFEAGERLLFAGDFGSDNLGDFPQGLDYIRGNMEVAEMDDGRRLLLATANHSQFSIGLPSTLPDQFTVEFDIHDPITESGTWVTTEEPDDQGRVDGNTFNFGNWRGSGIWNPSREPLAVTVDETLASEVVTARIMADAQHVKVYLNAVRVSNVPRVDFARGNRLFFTLDGRADRPIYVGNIRIAAGGRDLYDALTADGRVEINDILFDTGSDVILSESASVLAEIGTMLSDHPDLQLIVEGHTDNEGDFDNNMELSGMRAASVKAYLIENFGIESDRLRTMGLGQTRPVDSNDTPEGRQRNRRVELVRM